MKKQRLDNLMVERGLAENKSRAKAMILAGNVVVGDHRVDKAGAMFDAGVEIRLKGEPMPYVSRGGFKLAGALDAWPVMLEGAVCIDVGASTGGFTDVLLQRGVARVYAVDVGYGQLDWRLRGDARVVNMERTHIVKVPVGTFDPAPSIAVVDVSFISLKMVLPALLAHLLPQARVYTLIKPQFEVGREKVEKGGIVRDEKARLDAVKSVIAAAEKMGLVLIGYGESPITGMDGNVEYIAAFEWISQAPHF